MRNKLSKRRKSRAQALTGEDLVYLRQIAGLSQAQLARRAGLDRNHAHVMEYQGAIGRDLIVRCMLAIIKELRAQRRCLHSSHGVPPVDLDELAALLDRPLSGPALARVVRLRTERERRVFAQRGGLNGLGKLAPSTQPVSSMGRPYTHVDESTGRKLGWHQGLPDWEEIPAGSPSEGPKPVRTDRIRTPAEVLGRPVRSVAETKAVLKAESERAKKEREGEGEVTISDIRWGR